MGKEKVICCLTIIFLSVNAYAFHLKCIFYHFESNEALEGISAAVLKDKASVTNAESDGNGIVSIEGLEAGNYILIINAPGFYEEKRDVELNKDMSFSFYLRPKIYQLGFYEVIGEKEKAAVSKFTFLKKDRQRSMTTLLGNPTQVLDKIPGVESGDLMSSGLNSRLSVRGGGDSENLVLFDGFYVIRPFHAMFGDSIFLSDLIGDMVLYKGVLPSCYGQSLSSVLNLKSEPAKPYFHGRLDIGALNASLALNGTGPDGKLNWSAGLRRMNYDLIQSVNKIYTGNFNPAGDTNFAYYDSQGKITYTGPENIFDLAWIFSYEPMTFYHSGTYWVDTWDELLSLGLRWKHSFPDKFSLEQTVQWSGYTKSFTIDDRETPINYKDENKLDLVTYKNLWNIYSFEAVSAKTGFEIFYYPLVSYASSVGNASSTNYIDDTVKAESGSVMSKTNLGIYSFFLDSELTALNPVSFLIGSRVTYCDIINKANIDPRISCKYTSDIISLMLSFGRMTEFFTDPFLFYSYSNQVKEIDLSECWQSSAGGRLSFCRSYSLDSEVYFKYYDNLPVKGDDDLYHTGISFTRVYGLDLMFRKQPGAFPVYGWLSFSTFKREIFRREGISENSGFTGGFFDTGRIHYGFSDADLINYHYYGNIPVNQWYDGNSMDYKINMTVIWEINKEFVLSGEFNLVSGDRYTPVAGAERHAVIDQSGNTNIVYTPVYGDYHSARLPDKHKLSLKLEWNSETKKGIPYGFYYQLDNVYNYQAVVRYDYNYDFSKKTEVRELLGFTPIVGFWMKW